MTNASYNLEKIKAKVKERFGKEDSYLLAFKHGDFKIGISKIVSTNILFKREKSDLYILYFDENGIYINNIRDSLDDEFKMTYWNKVDFVNLVEKNKSAVLEISHSGEIYGFELLFEGEIFSENERNLKELKRNNWNKDESLDELL